MEVRETRIGETSDKCGGRGEKRSRIKERWKKRKKEMGRREKRKKIMLEMCEEGETKEKEEEGKKEED